MPDRTYNGTVLVDQYQTGMPMKFVLRNIEDFQNLRKYFEKHFRNMVMMPSKKPLLVLEITESQDLFARRTLEGLSDADIDFLETYFELADPTNPEVCKFFQRCQSDFIETMYRMPNDVKVVGRSLGEIVFDDIEKKSIDFKAVDAAGAVMTVVIGWLVFESCKNTLKNQVVEPAQKEFVKHFELAKKFGEFKKTVNDNKLLISGTLGVGLAAWIAYRLATQEEKEEDLLLEDVLAGDNDDDINFVQEAEEVV
ncbi:hypothetical protein IPF37_02640 [bacterium]|nr:MAG: hypothetical protein IPF37_02640 [bacterium]